jgi:hypothetical protein
MGNEYRLKLSFIYTEDELDELELFFSCVLDDGRIEYLSKDGKEGYYLKRLKDGKLMVQSSFIKS